MRDRANCADRCESDNDRFHPNDWPTFVGIAVTGVVARNLNTILFFSQMHRLAGIEENKAASSPRVTRACGCGEDERMIGYSW